MSALTTIMHYYQAHHWAGWVTIFGFILSIAAYHIIKDYRAKKWFYKK